MCTSFKKSTLLTERFVALAPRVPFHQHCMLWGFIFKKIVITLFLYPAAVLRQDGNIPLLRLPGKRCRIGNHPVSGLCLEFRWKGVKRREAGKV